MYEMLMSVDTPVEYSPLDAAASELDKQLEGRMDLPPKINHCGNCSAMQYSQSIRVMLLDDQGTDHSSWLYIISILDFQGRYTCSDDSHVAQYSSV